MRKLSLSVLVLSSAVYAGGIPIGLPNQEITQLIMRAQQALQYERQAQQLYNEIQMVRMMTQNGIHLADIPALSTMIMSDVAGMRNLIQLGQGLSYGFAANDANFRSTYATYAQNLQQTPFYQQYSRWAESTMNMALSQARMAGLTQDQVWNEQQMNARLQAMMSTPIGQQHALEVANSLSFNVMGQLQKLRSLIASDMQSKAVFSGYQISKDQAKELDTSAATAYVEREADHRQFGSVPNASR